MSFRIPRKFAPQRRFCCFFPKRTSRPESSHLHSYENPTVHLQKRRITVLFVVASALPFQGSFVFSEVLLFLSPLASNALQNSRKKTGVADLYFFSSAEMVMQKSVADVNKTVWNEERRMGRFSAVFLAVVG